MCPKEEKTFSDHLKKLETDYKVLWCYYQCMQSLMRSLLKPQRIENVNFEILHEEFKSIESIMQQLPENEIREKLSDINNQLQRYKYILYQYDEKIPPSLTRRFIEKLEKYDIRFLVYFSQFYLRKAFLTQDDWDKIDLIFTKLFIIPDENSEFYRLREHEQIKSILSLMSKDQSLPTYSEIKVNDAIMEFGSITKEIRKVADFSNLLEWGLLARIRDFKKSLKHLMLHPDVLLAMLTLNKTSKNKFISLYRDEINKIGLGIEIIDKLGDTLEEIKEISESFSAPEIFPEEEVLVRPMKDSSGEFQQLSIEIKMQLERIIQILSQMPTLSEEFSVPVVQTEDEDLRSLNMPAFLKPYLEKIQKALTAINWEHPLSKIIHDSSIKDYQFETWELEAFQELFIQSHPEPFKIKVNKSLFKATLLRKSTADIADTYLELAKQHPASESSDFEAVYQQAQVHFDTASLYTLELQELIKYCKQKEFYTLAKYLNRALKKLERAQIGLWLLHDEHIDIIGSPSNKTVVEENKKLTEPVKIHFEIIQNKKKKKS